MLSSSGVLDLPVYESLRDDSDADDDDDDDDDDDSSSGEDTDGGGANNTAFAPAIVRKHPQGVVLRPRIQLKFSDGSAAVGSVVPTSATPLPRVV